MVKLICRQESRDFHLTHMEKSYRYDQECEMLSRVRNAGKSAKCWKECEMLKRLRSNKKSAKCWKVCEMLEGTRVRNAVGSAKCCEIRSRD